MEIIGIAGAKNAGKDSAAKLITGMVMQKIGMIQDYDMTEDGELIIYHTESSDGVSKRQESIFDLDNRSEAFQNYLYEVIWPHVKTYHFADALKVILSSMFGLSVDMLFGTQEDKASPSLIKWGQMVDIVPKKKLKKNINLEEYMTYREVMQYFADVMKNVDNLCFVKNCLQQIDMEQVPISIIADVRTEPEVIALKAKGAKIIYLTKRPEDNDAHHIENGLVNTDRSVFDIVIDNQNMSMGEKNVKLVNALKDIGFLQ
jgi:hypothetical protein